MTSLSLYEDLLIGVTRFFRDDESFAALEQRIVPDIIVEDTPDGAATSLRIREADLERHLTNDKDNEPAVEQEPAAATTTEPGT